MAEFTYCLNTSTIRPTPLLEKIRLAARAGYEAIEPWNDEIDDFVNSGGTIAEVKKAIADSGLKVVSVIALHSWITAQGEPRARALDECRRRMDQAVILGSPYIVASPPQEIVNLEHAGRCYAELLEIGRAAGVKPAMEFLGFVSGIKSVATAWAVAAGARDDDATIVADVFHLLRGGGALEDLTMVDGNRMAIFHINDLPADPPFSAQTDHDRVMVGDGVADVSRVIALLRRINYRGPLSLELFNKEVWAKDPFDVIQLGLDRVRALVEN